jgi:hypothetical protein
MKMKARICSTALFSLIACVPSAHGQQEGITGVGRGPSNVDTVVLELSADGTAAAGQAGTRIFRWARTSATTGELVLMPLTAYNADTCTSISSDGVHVFGYGRLHQAGVTQYKPTRWSPPYTAGAALTLNQAGGACTGGMPLDNSVGSWLNLGTVPSWNSLVWLITPSGQVSGTCFSVAGFHLSSIEHVSRNGQVMLGRAESQVSSPSRAFFIAQGPPEGPWTTSVTVLESLSLSISALSKDGHFAFGNSADPAARLRRWPVQPTGLGPPESFATPPGVTNLTVMAANLEGTAAAGTLTGPQGASIFLWREGHGVVVIPDYLAASGINVSDWTFGGSLAGPALTSISDDGYSVAGTGRHNGVNEGYVLVLPRCGTADYNCDGDTGTDADIESFFRCLSGDCSQTCYPGGSDFNRDGDTGTDADIESFFRVLAGGAC